MVRKLRSEYKVNLDLIGGLPLILSTQSVGKTVVKGSQGAIMSSNNEAHGDEDWLAAEARECAELYEAEHADDWKYSDERLGYEHE